MPKIATTRPRAIEWLLIACLLASVWKHFWLMDDAFIYFRYLDNLLFLQRGLVFNPGEYVEGFTSPLWLIILIPFRFLQLDYWAITRLLALATALAFGLLVVRVNRLLQPERPTVNLPLALAAGHYGLASHFSSGLETPLVQLWASLIALWMLRPSTRWLQVLSGLGPLVRPELLVVVVLAGAFSWWKTRRLPAWFAGSLLAFNGAWLGFRIYYYADLLPNTFYLKNGQHWNQGLWYLWNELHGQWWAIVVPLAWLALAWLRRGRPELATHIPERAMMIALAAVQTLWVAKVGGDMIYHRFLAAPVVLVLLSTAGVAEHLLALSRRALRSSMVAPAGALCAFAAVFACHPPQLLAHPWTEPKERQWHAIEEAAWHRRHHQLAPTPTRAAEDRKLLDAYATWNARPHQAMPAMKHPWCRRAFFEFNKYVVHSYGLTDAVLARIEAPVRRPGHRKLGPFAAALVRVASNPADRGPTMFRRSIERHRAPRWVAANIATIDVIAQKAYNQHQFWRNAALALRRLPRIDPAANSAPQQRPRLGLRVGR